MELHRFPFDAMGSPCELQLYAPSASFAEAAAQLAIAEIERIEARYSRYRDDSTLSEINRIAATGGSLEVDDETAGLLDYAFACYHKSDGLFDITSGVLRTAWDFDAARVPEQPELDALLPRIGMDKLSWHRPALTFSMPGMEIDFGGIGKEYAADQAAAVCAGHGIAHGLIELGGDIRVLGPHPHESSMGNSPWIVGIRDPRDPECALTTVELSEGAVATSGNYERYIEVDGVRHCHILNPRTGRPARGLAAVSVVSPHCLVAGSVATIAMLKGQSGKQWLHDMGVRHVWVDEAGNWMEVTGK